MGRPPLDVHDPAIAHIAKYKCLNSLLYHTRFFFRRAYNRRFTVNSHHERITEALERVFTGKCTKLMIWMPPRYGKTEIAVKSGVSHGFSLNAAANFIHLSYSSQLALSNSEAIKDTIESPAYQALFPYVKLKPDTASKQKWATTAGGGMYALAAGGSVTGFGAGITDTEKEEDDEDLAALDEALGKLEEHYKEQSFSHNILDKYKFGGAIIIDDPIKPEDADKSDLVRERINDRFDSTIRNRVNSSKTPIIIIMQRLHPMDLCGYLMTQEPGEWEVLCLPAINEKGEALWPGKHSIEQLENMRRLYPLVFERQYMQNPKPREGLLFHEEELQWYNCHTLPRKKLKEIADHKFAYIDPADDGGDDLAAPFCYLVGNKVYVDDVIFNTDGADINEGRIVDYLVERGFEYCEFEGNSAWKIMGKAIVEKVEARTDMCEIRIIKNTINKGTRIRAQADFIKRHFLFNSNWRNKPEYVAFITKLCAYLVKGGNSQHDDAPDSLSGCAKYLRENFSHLWLNE